MTLTIGNKIVYPYRGPCRIGAVVDKTVGDTPTRFYQLALLDDTGGELFVPLDKVGDLGIRRLMQKSEIPKLLGRLRKGAATGHQLEQRAIDNIKLLSSGSAFDLRLLTH